jgi:hypothetical protein
MVVLITGVGITAFIESPNNLATPEKNHTAAKFKLLKIIGEIFSKPR